MFEITLSESMPYCGLGKIQLILTDFIDLGNIVFNMGSITETENKFTLSTILSWTAAGV